MFEVLKPIVLLSLIAMAGGSAAVAQASPVGLASPEPAVAPLAMTPTSPVVLPPSLVLLEQKMGELKITSLRFSEQASVAVPHGDHKILSLLKLFGLGSRNSGEVTIAPPAADLTLSLFGQPLTLRAVGETTYLYLAKLAAVDHDRPWIMLGRGGLGELFTVNGHPVKAPASTKPKIAEPTLAEPPFAALQEKLAGAREVRELGPGTLDGQPVTRFLAILKPSQPVSGRKFGTAHPLRRPAPTPATTTLELSLAQSGLPVQTKVVVQHAGVTTTDTLEIPAINFPLVIEAPPAAQTITLAELKALERHHKHKTTHKGKQRKSKQ
jgi:hypothetical protein